MSERYRKSKWQGVDADLWIRKAGPAHLKRPTDARDTTYSRNYSSAVSIKLIGDGGTAIRVAKPVMEFLRWSRCRSSDITYPWLTCLSRQLFLKDAPVGLSPFKHRWVPRHSRNSFLFFFKHINVSREFKTKLHVLLNL